MLKTKAGEATALANLTSAEKDRLAPVFHVGEKPPATFVAKMAAAWTSRVCFLDGAFNFNVSGAPSAFDKTFTDLGNAGVVMIPVIEIDAPAGYNQAAFAHVGQFAPGLLLKCTPANLGQAVAYAQQMQISLSQVDLLIDAGHIPEFDPQSFAGYIGQVLQSNLAVGIWRSVTLASSAAPKDFGQLALGTQIVPRRDWLLWSNIPKHPGIPVDFADFATSHRDLTEPPGVAMAGATVSVRYTIEDNWVMVKGRRTTGVSGVPMGDQYRAHAKLLVARPDFDQLVPNCWADQRIASIAAGSWSAGGRLQWVEIGANRHFAFIASRLP